MASTINASTSAGLVSTADTSGVLQLQTAGTTAVSIDASQAVTFSAGTANGVAYLNGSKVLTTGSALTFDGTNLGVGGTASGSKLHVINAGTVSAKVENTAGTGAAFSQFKNTAGSTYFGQDATGGYLLTDYAAPLLFYINNAEQMRLTSTGLGIGTSSPSRKLEVSGIFRQTDGTVQAEIASGGSVAYYGTNNNYPVAIQTNAVERARFDTSGNLALNGVAGFNVLGFEPATAIGSGGVNYITSINTTNLAFKTALTERVRIDVNGNVGIGTASPNASAILDAQSTTKGVRMPNMTTTQKNAISSPAAGLMVFDTTLAKLCVYSGSAWQTITSV